MNPRIAMWGFIVAVVVLHGVVAYLAPISQTDWDYLIWIAQHRREPMGTWFVSFITSQHTITDVLSYAVIRYPFIHAVVTPLLGLAAVWGTFTFAMRRLPKFDAWGDVALVVVTAALLWIAAPRCGLTYFHRPFAMPWLGGTALLLWYLVPLRCGWRVQGWHVGLVILVGFLAATSTRQFGMVAIAATGYAIKKTPKGERPTWLWIALAAVIAGAALGFAKALFDFRGFKPGWEASLVQLNVPIYEGGELVSFVAGLVLLKLVVGRLWPQHAGEPLPDTRETLRWFGVWFAYIVIALLGPKYAEGALYPAAVMLVVAVFPTVQWIMTSKPLRTVVLVIAVAINVIAWSCALSTYANLVGQYRERMTILRAAPRRSVATVKTYSQIRPEFWAYGEDWQEAERRQYVAAALFKLSDIEMSPAFRRLEYNPKLTLRLETTGVTTEQLTAAGAPEQWPSTLKNARALFGDIVARLKPPPSATLRLVVNLPFEILHGRPLLVAAHDSGGTTTMSVKRTRQDEESKIAVLPTPSSIASRYAESYTVINGRAVPVKFARRRYLVQGLTTELHAVIACDPSVCFLVDAFIPSL